MVAQEGTGDSPRGGMVWARRVGAEEFLEDSARVGASEPTPDVSARGAEVREGTALVAEVRSARIVAKRAKVSVPVMERCGVDFVQGSIAVSPVSQVLSPCAGPGPSGDVGIAG